MNITQIKNAKPGEVLWDDEIKGLHLRCYPSGKKQFLYYYRIGKTIQRRPVIGEFGQITLAEARKLAKEVANQVDRGLDPSAARAKARSETTIEKLFEATMKDHWSEERYVRSGHRAAVLHLWEKHLKEPFGKLGVSQVDRQTVKAWHASLKKKPYAANRSKAVLSKVFHHAYANDLITVGTNPCLMVENFVEQSRERFATTEERKKIEDELAKYKAEFPHAVTFIRATFNSGARLVALERLRRDELEIIEKDGKRFGVARTMGKTSHDSGKKEVIIFPPQILDDILALPETDSGTLFGTKYPRWLWRKVKAATGITGLWARDSRRTYASVGLSNGIASGTIGEMLNHSSAETTKIYAKLMLGNRLDAAEQIAAELEKSIEPKGKKK